LTAAINPVPKGDRPRICVFSGSANPALTDDICMHLGAAVGRASVQTFADGEIYLQIEQNVRGMDVFIVQPTCGPVDRNLVELLLFLDALRRSSAKRITAVLPYYGYSRQDRKDKPRVPISAKLVASLIETAGANRVLTMDLHAAQIQGFFDTPVDHLYAAPVFADRFRRLELPNLTVVSPDAGGVERARAFAKRMQAPLAIVDKRREKPNEAEVMNVIGDVRGRNCVIVDDLVDTAGTLVKSAAALKDQGAVAVWACCSHAVLSGPAIERINGSVLEELWVSDSIPLKPEAEKSPKIRQLSVSLLFARAIASIYDETSISELFE
jgi:ribose-phosphate pyrophosphokinase